MNIKKLIRTKLNEANSNLEFVNKIRQEFRKHKSVKLGDYYPIVVEMNNIKRKFLVQQKTISRSARMGEGESKLYVKYLVLGRTINSEPIHHIWKKFEITEKGVIKDIGYPKDATEEEIKDWDKIKLNESQKEKIQGTKVFGEKLAQCDLNFLETIKETARRQKLDLSDSEAKKYLRFFSN